MNKPVKVAIQSPHIVLKSVKNMPISQPLPEIKTTGIVPDDILRLLGMGFSTVALKQFNAYVEQIKRETDLNPKSVFPTTDSEARKIAQESVGYEAIRYSHDHAAAAEQLLGAYHPVFGKVIESRSITDAMALQAGFLLGRLNKAGYKLQETLLYFPLRTAAGLTLEAVLKNPEYDPILGPLCILTAEEEKLQDEKEDAFFKTLKI